MDGPCAIGRMGAGGLWLGFVREAGRYRLAVGAPSSPVRSGDADDDLLLALAIVYFEDVLDDPPPDIEATHADLSDLVRDVARRAADGQQRLLLAEAIDSLDDGLAVDEVIARLSAARGLGPTEEQVDALDLLRERAAALSARP